MTEPTRPRRRKWLRRLGLFAAFGAAVLGLLGWYVTTDSFQQTLRRHLIAALEQATGGRVELAEIHTTPVRLRVEIRNLTVHGREAADEVPLFHVDRLHAKIEIISLLAARFGLHSLELEHPVVHVIVYPDGSTNQPAPKTPSEPTKHAAREGGVGPAVAQLFSIAIPHVVVERGEVLWQENRIPLDFDARDVVLKVDYSFLHQNYAAAVTLGSVRSRVRSYPPLNFALDASLILARDHADIHALRVTTGRSSVQFTGSVPNFDRVRVAGEYRASLDLSEVADFLQRRDLRRGTAVVEGKGSWSLEEFSADGTLQVKDLDALSNGIRFQNDRLSTTYSITPQRLHFASVTAEVMGGRVKGDIDVANWQSSPTKSTARSASVVGRTSPGGPQRGSIRLQLAGFPLDPLLVLASSKKLPLSRLRLTGILSGEVESAWVGSFDDAQTRVDLNLTPPAQPQAGLLPARGQIRGVYVGSRDELQLDQFHVATPASEITAAGMLAAATTLHFSLTSHDMAEWGLFLGALSGEALPFAVHGWASLNGNLSGKLSALQMAGNIEVYDFDASPPERIGRVPAAIHWDSLTAAIQYSNNSVAVHNAALIHGHTVVHFNGSTGLVGGVPAEDSQFSAQLEIRNADLAEMQELVGSKEAMGGTLNLTAQAYGTRADPHGQGQVEIRDGSAYGLQIPTLHADLALAEGELQVTKIESSVFGAPITGSAAWNLSTDQFRLNLTGRGVDLAHLPKAESSRIAIDGLADFTIEASGTRDQPSLAAHIHLRDLAFDKEHAGDFYLDVTPEGGKLNLQGHSEFDKSDLKISGSIGMGTDFPADLNVVFDRLDIDSLLRVYLSDRVSNHALARGTIGIHGPLRTPRELTVLVNVESFEGEVEHVQLHNVEPIRVEVADRSLRLEQFHLAGNGTDFTAHGTAQLNSGRELDFQLGGTVNLALLRTVNPKLTARGVVAVSLSAGGTAAMPVLQGKLEVQDAAISHSEFPSGLSDLNGVLRFDQNGLQIESLQGHTGGGDVSLTGTVALRSGTVGMDVSARARNVRLRYPTGVSSTANANLRLSGSLTSAVLSGNVHVTKLAITPGMDFASYLEKSKQATLVAQNDTLASHVKLDVRVTTTPELQMQTAVAKLSGNADLHLQGTVDRPVVTGRAEVLEGEIVFNGTKYKLERGDVSFPNPSRTTPVVDFQAATRVRDYDITVNLSGDVTKANGLVAKWRSEPPLPEADVIALLALGRTREEAAALQSTGASGLSGEASNLLLNQALNSAVTSRVQRLFGVSRIKIDPQGITSTTNMVRGPQVTIEQQVASRVTITYSTNVTVASQQIIQVEYNVTRNVSVVALRDQNGVVSFDVKIRQRKR